MLIQGIEVPEWALLGPAAGILCYWYTTRDFGYFKKAGIPGPKAYPLLGTMGSMYGQALVETDMNYRAEYGKLVGTFEGNYRNLMIYDADFMKEAFTKNYHAFTNRRVIRIGGPLDASLLNLTDDHWKYVRSALSPTFTQGKLKMMLPHIQHCADVFTTAVGEDDGKHVDVRKRVYAYTSDVIATTAFGLDTDCQTNPDSKFTKYARLSTDAFENTTSMWDKIKFGFNMGLIVLAPSWLVTFLYEKFGVSAMNYEAMQYFESVVTSSLKQRMNTTEPGHDFVQTMADSVKEAPKGSPDTLYDSYNQAWSRKGLTMNEVVGNAMIFILAGFQTTADTLLFLFYELAVHPEIQQRLYEEITTVCDADDITMEQVQKLKYLECVLNETLRLYPQGFRFDREASQDVTVSGIEIKKGQAVTVSPWVIHRDPEYWTEPEEFNPDRFLPENSAGRHPNVFIPFGIGNRACIGNRLALLEMKVLAIQVLKMYSVEKCENTPPRPIKFKAVATIAPLETIYVNLVRRHS